jgi:signal transduction histidine kinase
MKVIRALCLLILLPLFNFSESFYSYDIATERSSSEFDVHLLVDSTNNMTLNDVIDAKEAFRLSPSRIAIPHAYRSYWYAFQLENSGSETKEYIIGFDEVFMETVDFYCLSATDTIHQRNGLSVIVANRSERNRCPIYRVVLESGAQKTIYIKAYSEFELIIGLVKQEYHQFLAQEEATTMWYWLYFGAAIAILIYNLFLLIYIRERLYLYYVIYAFFFVLFTFVYSGYVQYLTANVKILYSLDFSIATMGGFITLFTRELLKTKELKVWIDNVLIGISAVYFIMAVLIIIDIYFYQFLVSFSMPFMFFLLFTGIYAFSQKVPFSRYYVLAVGSYIVGLIMIAAVNLGLIPFNTVTRYGFMIGSLLELLLFSYAIGYRIKYLQDQRNQIQKKLLHQEREHSKLLQSEVDKQTAELRASKQKVLQLSDFKDDMTRMIIHDLKNPLNIIVNSEAIADSEMRDKLVKQAGSNMLNLVQNVLDVSKSEQDNLAVVPRIYNIRTLVEEAVDELQLISDQKELKVDYSGIGNHSISMDVTLIRRVVVNILSNAIKASPRNGVITFVSHQTHSEIKISISNQGPSIPKDKQTIIFEKFKQLHDGKSAAYSSGLGLTFCKMAIEAHQGSIGVVSEQQTGVEFWFTLPIVE